MSRPDDVLDLLLPRAESRVVKGARNVTHFLRLLSDDARPARAASVGIDLDRARHEFDRQDRREVRGALCDLLRHHLDALTDSDGFAWSGAPRMDVQSAWATLLEFRGELEGLAGVPEPDESALSVAERLLASLERVCASEEEHALWRARLARHTAGPRAAERSFRALVAPRGGATAQSDSPRGGALGHVDAPRSGAHGRAHAPRGGVGQVLRASVAGVAECMLDRGAVREAHAWLSEHGAITLADARLRQLSTWCKLCLGDLDGAKALLAGARPWNGALPAGLAELRVHRPAWIGCLSGKTREYASRGASRAPIACERDALAEASRSSTSRAPSGSHTQGATRDRSELGASVMVVFVFRPGFASETIACDVAPALRDKVTSWLAEREGACARPGEREHAMVVRVESVVVHRDGEPALAGALGGSSTRSMALVPVLDEDGEAAGWVHWEWEHHLQPSARRLRALADRCRAEVRARRGARRAPRVATPAASPNGERIGVPRECDPRADVFHALIDELGMKTAQRRWWGFTVDDPHGDWELVAQGGEGVGLAGDGTGERRALARAAATLGCVAFDEPDARLSIDARASSGLVVPLRAAGRIVGLFAVESSRRRDFRAADIEWLVQVTHRTGLALAVARFRVWHRDVHGFDVCFDAQRADFAPFAVPLLIAARSRAPVLVRGPRGAGKRVVARWLHFASAAQGGVCHVRDCATSSGDRSVARALEASAGGSVVFHGVEHLDADRQDELAQWLESEDVTASVEEAESGDPAAAAPRVFATTGLEPTAAAGQVGALRPRLAHRLDRLQIRVPPLRERREDIVGMVACLAARFAAAEGMQPLRLSDTATALLWRQRWEENVRELENFVYKLVLFSRGDLLDADDLVAIARQFHVKLERRLPSRHPDRADLLAALRATRMPLGRWNKTRAAMYLGWDPDTLVVRMSEAGITDAMADAITHDDGEPADAPVPADDEPLPGSDAG